MLVALGVLGYLLGRQLDLFGGGTSAKQAAVPNVIGADIKDAEAQVRTAGLVPVEEQHPNDVTPAGKVFDTDPKPGIKLDKGKSVTLKVSTGSSPAQVPNVIGQNVDDATSALQAAGFVVSQELQTDDKRPEGTVLNTDPRPGITQPKGSTVKLIVSSGKAKVLVPDETGRSVNDALRDLQQAGLQAKVVRQASEQPVDAVLSSDPPAGTQVDKGTVVTLTVSSGPAPTTTTTPPSTTTSSTPPSTTTSTTTKPTTTTTV
jgi:serine/threonine-protein kinase